MLSSRKFSTDSLNDTTEPFVDYYNNSNSNNGSPRRYSNSSLTNSPRIGRANSNSATSRSSSIICISNGFQQCDSEDGQPIQPVFNNTPRSRNSLTFGIKHRFLQHLQIIYSTPLAAPTGHRSSSNKAVITTENKQTLSINIASKKGSSQQRANNNNNKQQ